MSVTENVRFDSPHGVFASGVGASGISARAFRMFSRGSTDTFSSLVTRTSTGAASLPLPRVSEKYSACDYGCVTMSVMRIWSRVVPRAAAIFPSTSLMRTPVLEVSRCVSATSIA